MASQPQGQVIPPDDSEESQEVPLSSTMLTAVEGGDRRSMIAAAKANPRSLVVFRRELDELVSISESVAAEMTYSLPRGAIQIIGPSVRFAEAVAYCYRNLRAISEIVDVGDKQITAQGGVYDAERNNGRAERVSRNITGSRGRFNQDMIAVTGNAACSIAYRNAVLHYVPKALWLDSWEKSKQIVTGGVETMAKKRSDALQHFNSLEVTDVMVFNALGVRGLEEIDTDSLVAMRTWFKEIKDRKRSIEDIFGSPLDVDIEATMKALGWNETRKRVSRLNFAGNREGHLKHVHAEAEKAGIKVDVPANAQKTEQPKEEAKATENPTDSSQPKTSPTPDGQATQQRSEEASANTKPQTATTTGPAQNAAPPKSRTRSNW